MTRDGNRGPVILLPGQPVALELDQAPEIYGDPVALVPDAALIGWRGILGSEAGPSDCLQIGLPTDR